MKYILILSIILSCVNPNTTEDSSLSSETTTYYLIRHAEKDRSDKTNRNPELTKAGHKRAKRWKKYFKNVSFDAVYSTDYNRTKQTAQPTAKNNNVDISIYDPRQLYADDFKKATQGKTVLVVGHSNTTPAFVNAILGEKKYDDMDDTDNSSLFIVTISDGKITDKVITVN